jgi:hypothetical protein
MDGQELLEQEAAFEASFAGNEQPTTSAPATAEPAGAAAETDLPAAGTGGQEPPAPGDQQQDQAPAPAADDPVVFGGFKQSEVQRLFEQAAKVGDLELQLRKAHGHIGDLKRHMGQQPSAQQVPPQTAPAPANPKLEQFKQDFPEIAEYIHAVVPQAPPPQAKKKKTHQNATRTYPSSPGFDSSIARSSASAHACSSSRSSSSSVMRVVIFQNLVSVFLYVGQR